MNRFQFRSIFIGLLTFFIFVFSGLSWDGQALSYISQNGVSVIPIESKADGLIKLQGKTKVDKLKILVMRDKDQKWFDVNINEGNFNEEIWLTEGTGSYTVALMVNEDGRKYSFGPKFTIKNTKEVNKYLAPTKHIESNNEKVIELSRKIVEGKNTDLEKVKAIYEWVADNIKYDYKKYSNHQKNNYDNNYGALVTLETNKGVCYDYSTLVAALGRAAQLETKVIEGEGITNGFRGLHAWNEIYISEENRWIKLDSTFAATSGSNYFDTEDFDDSHIKEKEY